MLRRASLLVLAATAAVATSPGPRFDYRAPCVNNNTVASWDPNVPLYMKWYGREPLPVNSNLYDGIVLTEVGGGEVDFWLESPGTGIVLVCPKEGLKPETEYEWRVRQFVNDNPNATPVPYFEHTGVTRFRTTATSEHAPIGSPRQCRRFSDFDFATLPACTNAYIDNDFDGFQQGPDCNDADPTVFPAAPELCDGTDNDCDGQIDEGLELRVWPDDDDDGFGDGANPVDLTACDSPEGFVANGADCNDADATIHPAATDVPANGVDEDCDGEDAVDVPTADTGGTADTGSTSDTGTTETASTGETG